MTMIKCDRCGIINGIGSRIIIYEGPVTISDIKFEGDLCYSCKESLIGFLKPLKQVVKGD